MTPMQEKIERALNELSDSDMYSLLMFVLFQIKEIKEYSTLSELVYILDHKNLMRLLKYYGGMTITIPTEDDLNLIIDALLIYDWVNIKGNSLDTSKKMLGITSAQYANLLPFYEKLVRLMSKYNFNTRQERS